MKGAAAFTGDPPNLVAVHRGKTPAAAALTHSASGPATALRLIAATT
jgi:hypothetical protein